MRAEVGPARLRVLPIKFVGGLLALSGGLALGREGPTVQMGAVVASGAGQLGRLPAEEVREVSAAAGGAGLGVAFSAPIGGMLFTLEEVAGRFTSRLVLVTLVTVSTALATSQVVVGGPPDFTLAGARSVDGWGLVLVAVLGVVCGLAGLLYNVMILASLPLVGRLRRIPPEAIAGVVGAAVAVVALISPTTVGGADTVIGPLLVGAAPAVRLVALLAVRWVMGLASYAVGTPGGLFAPMLAVGALLGTLVAAVVQALAPGFAISAPAMAAIGMVAFFTAVVRAPITAVVLTAELVGSTGLLIPMALAAAAATVVALALRADPTYETLRHRREAADAVGETDVRPARSGCCEPGERRA